MVRRRWWIRRRNRPGVPKKPKRPTTGYNEFVRQYLRTHPGEVGVFRAAAQAWRQLAPAQKAEFRVARQAERQQRQHQMNLYKERKQLMRRPGSAYHCFMRQYWERERQRLNGQPFQQNSSAAASAWRALTPEERRVFEREHAVLMRFYRVQINNIRRGEPVNQRWREQARQEFQEEERRRQAGQPAQ